MLVRELMTAKPVTCTPENTLYEAANAMLRENCGCLLVVDPSNEKLVGILTDRDIVCRAVAHGIVPHGARVKHFMTAKPVRVLPATSVDECAVKMKDHGIRRIPVVNENGRCLGIVTQSDLIWRGQLGEIYH